MMGAVRVEVRPPLLAEQPLCLSPGTMCRAPPKRAQPSDSGLAIAVLVTHRYAPGRECIYSICCRSWLGANLRASRWSLWLISEALCLCRTDILAQTVEHIHNQDLYIPLGIFSLIYFKYEALQYSYL